MLPPDELTQKWTKVLNGHLCLDVNDCSGHLYPIIDIGTQGGVIVRYHLILRGVPANIILDDST